MHRAERAVAVAQVLDEDANPDEVEDLVELFAADHHLLVDRIEVFRAALDLRLHAELLELSAGGAGDFVDQGSSLTAAALDQIRDLVVRTGVQRLERQVLELPLHLLDTEAVRERPVDLEGL